jgi:hypothetical protein
VERAFKPAMPAFLRAFLDRAARVTERFPRGSAQSKAAKFPVFLAGFVEREGVTGFKTGKVARFYTAYLRNASTALSPPKANEFEIATSTSALRD